MSETVSTPELAPLREALLGVGVPVYHFFAAKAAAPWLVWGEDGAGDTVQADNRVTDQVLGGTVDLFTRTPDDPTLFCAVQQALSGVCAWRLESIQYEEDTGLTHYEWRWEVA